MLNDNTEAVADEPTPEAPAQTEPDTSAPDADGPSVNEVDYEPAGDTEPAQTGHYMDGSEAPIVPIEEQDNTPVNSRDGATKIVHPSDVRAAVINGGETDDSDAGAQAAGDDGK